LNANYIKVRSLYKQNRKQTCNWAF